MEITYREDKTLIGGLVIRIGDRVIDTSIKSRLEELRLQLSREFPSKPERRKQHERRCKDLMNLKPGGNKLSDKRRDQRYSSHMSVAEVGTVIQVADGIARIHGLEKAMQGELLEFPHGVRAWYSTWRRIT